LIRLASIDSNAIRALGSIKLIYSLVGSAAQMELVDPDRLNFRLTENSPARNQGRDTFPQRPTALLRLQPEPYARAARRGPPAEGPVWEMIIVVVLPLTQIGAEHTSVVADGMPIQQLAEPHLTCVDAAARSLESAMAMR
jgi:hypothetical protein